MSTTVSRRRAPRHGALLKVDFDGDSPQRSALLSDLSEGGLFINTTQHFEIGARLQFSISLPGVMPPIALAGIVRRRQANTTDPSRAGVGVEFVFGNESQRQEVKNLVQRLSREAAPLASSEPVAIRFLIADDNTHVCELFKYALEHSLAKELPFGTVPQIVVATNGREAWQRLDSERFDVAILDYHLPDVDGIQVLRLIRADARMSEMPVVMISSSGDTVKLGAERNGASIFIPKPVQAHTLIRTLTALLATPVGECTLGGNPEQKEPEAGVVRNIAQGEVLFCEGDAGSHMYLIRDGQIRVFRQIGSEEMVLAVLGSGAFLGEMAVLEGLPRSATAVAEVDTSVLEVDRNTLNDVLRKRPEVGMRLLGKLASRVRSMDARLEAFIVDMYLVRALDVLRGLAQDHAARADGWHCVPSGAKSMAWIVAEQAGFPVQQASAVVATLERAGCIRREGADFLIGDAGTLSSYETYLDLKRKYELMSGSMVLSGGNASPSSDLVEAFKAQHIDTDALEQRRKEQFGLYMALRTQFDDQEGLDSDRGLLDGPPSGEV